MPSLVARADFSPPPTSYPASAGLIGIYIYICQLDCNLKAIYIYIYTCIHIYIYIGKGGGKKIAIKERQQLPQDSSALVFIGNRETDAGSVPLPPVFG